MSNRAKLWITSTILYALFFGWYTNLGGPLSDKEVDEYVAERLAAGSDPDTLAYMEKFFRNDDGRQFLMINALDYNENPGIVEGAEPGDTAQQLMARYFEHIIPELLLRASHPAIIGDAIHTSIDVVGLENAKVWDSGALFRYRSRRVFLEIIRNPDLLERHHFKQAALSKTIAYPIGASLYLGDLRLILGLVLLTLTLLVDNRMLSKRRHTKI